MQPTFGPCCCSVDSVSLDDQSTTFMLHDVCAGSTTTAVCGVQLLWNHLSAEFWSCRSTHFTVTIPVTNAPLGTVPIVRNTER